MSKDIKDKVVVITGGASGIGYEIAKRFAEKQAKVVILLDLSEELGTEAAKAINAKFGKNKAVSYKCDVTTDLEAVWKKITDNFENVDVLVNNAGIFNDSLPKETIDVNVLAVINWALKFWEHNRTDRSGKGGTIINLASIYGFRVDPYSPVYQASKFAVMGFTKSLGHTFNFNRSGIRVVAICPGFTETPLVQDMNTFESTIKMYFSEFAKKNLWQKPDAVGNAVVEVFERADSGTAWLIEGNRPIEEVV